LRPYVTAGIGAYIPKQGSTKFGINAGVGLEYFWTPAWSVEIGADGHRVLGSGDTKFVVTHLGLIRHW
jgi:hypothetical protein